MIILSYRTLWIAPPSFSFFLLFFFFANTRQIVYSVHVQLAVKWIHIAKVCHLYNYSQICQMTAICKMGLQSAEFSFYSFGLLIFTLMCLLSYFVKHQKKKKKQHNASRWKEKKKDKMNISNVTYLFVLSPISILLTVRCSRKQSLEKHANIRNKSNPLISFCFQKME